ncbi:hypothetical protein MRX96_028412 [Rhipicephalus microplus]
MRDERTNMRAKVIMAAPPPRVLRRKQEKTRRILCRAGPVSAYAISRRRILCAYRVATALREAPLRYEDQRYTLVTPLSQLV